MNKSLPIFPQFEKLSLNHKEVLQAIANNYPSSDFNFAGLFTWDVGENVMICSLNGNLIIRSADYVTHDIFYSFIGESKVDETIETLIDYAEKNIQNATLRLIPESVAKNISQAKHQVTEDRDNHDYIYLVSDLAQLKGGKYEKKRNILHGFARKYPHNLKEEELDLNDEKVREDIEQVIKRWQVSRQKTDDDVKDELIAVGKALEHHKTLNIRAFGIYHRKVLIAFNLFEILPGKIAIGHFHKADVGYAGVYEHLTHNLAKHLATLEVETMNYEQDLGEEGLRRSKESFHPARYIKKYTVTRKQS